MTVAGKLQPDPAFAPPEYRKSAGRPQKQQERAYVRKTDTLREYKACGGTGHFAMTCVEEDRLDLRLAYGSF